MYFVDCISNIKMLHLVNICWVPVLCQSQSPPGALNLVEEKDVNTEFHRIRYVIKKYISRYHGCIMVEALNSASACASQRKRHLHFLEEFPATTNSNVKVRRERRNMEHSGNCKCISKAGAQGSHERVTKMELGLSIKARWWYILSNIPGDFDLILKVTSSLWRKVTFFWFTYTHSLYHLLNNGIPRWCARHPWHRGKLIHPPEDQALEK